MANELSNFLIQSAPWLTAVGAVALGYLNHLRANKTSDQDRFQSTITELHSLYRNLVDDLREEVSRLRDLNVELTASNTGLLHALTELRKENTVLSKTVTKLTTRVNQLERNTGPKS